MLFVLSGCQANAISSDWHRVDPPVAAPDFTLPQLDAAPLTLSQLQGRVVIMEFWATWCGPCRFSLPSLEVISRRYKDRGVTVLLVNQGEASEPVRRWARGRFTAPILLDQELQAGRRYGVQGIPRLFIVDRDGSIVYSHAGYGGGLERNLTLILEQLLVPASEAVHG